MVSSNVTILTLITRDSYYYFETPVLSDPREYMKVVRHEGVHPSGLIESLWPLKEAAVAEKDVMIPFFGRGPEWKRIRAFMQTDLLSPQSAAAYIPGVIRAAEMASKSAPAYSDKVNDYLHLCAFDMFSQHRKCYPRKLGFCPSRCDVYFF